MERPLEYVFYVMLAIGASVLVLAAIIIGMFAFSPEPQTNRSPESNHSEEAVVHAGPARDTH